MVKQIVYLHNGEISVKKSDKTSTEFEILLEDASTSR